MKRTPYPVVIVVLLGIVGAACLWATVPGNRSEDFSGEKAFEHIRRMVALGPRPPGTPEAKASGDYIIGKLKDLGLRVEEQSFEAETPLGTRKMRNIIAKIPGKRPEFILLAGHYDTKYFKEFKFVGANDGGSSSGVMLEMARVLVGRRGEFTKWITFFDGEEAFLEWTDQDSLYGSRHMVRVLDRSGELASLRAMLLVDMVGGKSLRLKRETHSTPWLVDLIWKKAQEMGHAGVFVSERFSAFDDHYPFIQTGIPAVDLLDLTYPSWHRPEDTLDKIGSESLEIVGKVLLASLPKIESRLLAERP